MQTVLINEIVPITIGFMISQVFAGSGLVALEDVAFLFLASHEKSDKKIPLSKQWHSYSRYKLLFTKLCMYCLAIVNIKAYAENLLRRILAGESKKCSEHTPNRMLELQLFPIV